MAGSSNIIARASVALTPTLQGSMTAIKNQLNRSVNPAQIGRNWGTGISGGIAPSFKAMAGIAVASLTAIGTHKLLQGGITRAMNIDMARFRFKALGVDAAKAMDSCSKAVLGTAYSLDEAAKLAGVLSASGVEAGDEMTKVLSATAGAAAIGGVEFERIGLIMQRVAAKGHVSGRDLLQFSQAGVSATKVLADYLGKTSEEVTAMVSKGQIDFKTFSDAMYSAFGEKAKGASETFEGALRNLRAAWNRVTEKFATPVLEGLQKTFKNAAPVIDEFGNVLQPAADALGNIVANVSGDFVNKLNDFTNALKEGVPIGEALANSFGLVGNVVRILGDVISGFSEGFNLDLLGESFGFLEGIFKEIFNEEVNLSEFSKNLGVVFSTVLAGAIFIVGGALKVVIEVCKALASVILAVNDGIGATISNIQNIPGAIYDGIILPLGEAILNLINANSNIHAFFDGFMNAVINFAVFWANTWNNIVGTVQSVANRIQEIINTITGAFRGIGDFVGGLFNGGNFELSPDGGWHASGGVFSKPAIIGVGEGSSSEAVLPLNTRTFRNIADGISRNRAQQGGSLDIQTARLISELIDEVRDVKNRMLNERDFTRMATIGVRA